jgi:histidyl-tRNA synthetase
MLTKAPRGTYDILPQDSIKWQYIESIMKETAEIFGYREIRVPIFEHTELFQRGVGETTDIVSKEMFTIKLGW